jgi:hypothetical protein
MGGHHLILGTLTDFLTGQTVTDTHDERYRQKIARFLIEQRGYRSDEIERSIPLTAVAGACKAIVFVDFVIRISGRVGMIIKYGPGSLTTRERPALAASRLIEGLQVPLVVVTNGEGAEVLNGATGKTVATGFEGIPDRENLERRMADLPTDRIPKERMEMESRVLYAYEVDGACPCDETICRL